MAGVFVNRTTTDCDFDVSITTNLEAQCLKCADLAVLRSAGNNLQNDVQPAADRLIGNTTGGINRVNIFTVCDDANPRPAFNVLGVPIAVETTFDRCLDNAGINPGNGTISMMQALPSSVQALQENSLTTNVKPEAEIPSLNTETQNSDLNSLLENPYVKSLLQNPNLNAMLENPDVNALLADPNVNALLADPNVNALLADPNVKAQLEDSNVNTQFKNPTISALTGVVP